MIDLTFLLIEEKGSCLRNWKNESKTKLGREYLAGKDVRIKCLVLGWLVWGKTGPAKWRCPKVKNMRLKCLWKIRTQR